MKFLKRRKKRKKEEFVKATKIVEVNTLPVRIDDKGVFFTLNSYGGNLTLRLSRGNEKDVVQMVDNQLGYALDTQKLAIRHGDTVFLVPVRIIVDSADGTKNTV